VAIDIATETLITPNECARRCDSHISWVYRQFNPGRHGIRLEKAKLGGKTVTSVEALQRFVDRVTAAESGEPGPDVARPTASRQKAIEKADRELSELGV
jgi:predicted nucleic acid-binding Zn ribbon protein